MEKSIDFQEFQSIAKGVLKQICAYCDANDLEYYLAFGTLLGAVRHKDIIPWDYDIDIMMPRPDFNRLLQMTKEQPIAENLTVFSWENERNYYIPFLKVCDNRTRLVITKTEGTNIPLGIWVDIFPMDGSSERMEDNKKIQQQAVYYTRKAMKPFVAAHSWKSKLLRIPARVNSWFVPPCKYIEKATEIASTYDYASAKQVGWMASVDLDVTKELVDKSLYTPLKVPFGDFEACIPSGYHQILTQIYGDYMQLPPEKKRTIPKIKSYWVDK
ncbi:MAG: LicD family protein [Oscillospiraceae bacterium]|nr:LicD family protein [Oscillospiraceae bacterium]